MELLSTINISTLNNALYFCRYMLLDSGQHLRKLAATVVNSIQNDTNITVLPQSRTVLMKAIDLYSNRTDKSYSLTDCISMIYMENHKLTEALTDDRHFIQEGFIALLSEAKH